MFSTEPRVIFQNNQLAEVICQLRFPEILMIGNTVPVAFQEAIRFDYPIYSVRKEVPAPKVNGAPGNFSLENQPAITNYQFTSEDGVWRVNLTSNFISLTCTRYTCWEEFAQRLDKPLVAFIQTYKPAFFQRIGLRYLNLISRTALDLEDVPYSQLIQPEYLGILAMEEIQEHAVSRCTMDAEIAIGGGCKVKIHSGPGLVKKPNNTAGEQRFIFDQDIFMTGNIPVNHSAAALETIHMQAFSIFRSAITETLYQAMIPNNI